MQPLRQLLKPDTKFAWTHQLQSLLEESKDVICSEIEEGVRIFDKTKPTWLATDWSKEGIGFWLLQKHCKYSTISAVEMDGRSHPCGHPVHTLS